MSLRNPLGIQSSGARPRRVEDDPMFSIWSEGLPRLWFQTNRQATRLDSEGLYGSQNYAVVYSRTVFTRLVDPTQTIAVLSRGYWRPLTTALAVPTQTADRTINYSRTFITDLDEPSQTGSIVRPSGSPVNPIVAPPTGADMEGE